MPTKKKATKKPAAKVKDMKPSAKKASKVKGGVIKMKDLLVTG